MKKLIELGASIDAAICAADEWDCDFSFERDRKIRDVFMALPTVDAVPVVRCKDCKMFYMKKDIFGKVPWCKAWHRGTIETMFCGWGKRKDGDHAEGTIQEEQS